MAQGKRSDGKKITHKDKRLPSKDEIKTIELCLAIGYTMQGTADEIGISKDVLERWNNKIEEVSAAIQRGRARRRKRAYSCYFHQAFPIDENGRPTGKGDASLMRYYMGCREGWREKPKEIKFDASENIAPIIQYTVKEAIDENTKSPANNKKKKSQD